MKTHSVIISGSFRPEFSYQENIWAEELARRGERVSVVTASVKAQPPYETRGYTVYSLATKGLHSRHLYLETQVAAHVARLCPQRLLWFGPPQLFGRSLAASRPLQDVPMAIFMGQNRHMHAFDWKERGLTFRDRALALAYSLVRGPTIASACQRANLVVAATRQTPDIVRLMVPPNSWPEVSRKIMECPLGFDGHTFYDDRLSSREIRHQLGITQQDRTFLVTSRFASEKWDTLTKTYHSVARMMDQCPQARCVFVGLNGNEYSQRLRRMVQESPHTDRIHLEEFTSRRGLARLFNAADAVIFRRPSISCQEALGTGLYGVFAGDGSMDWLLESTDDGQFFKPELDDGLTNLLMTLVTRESDSIFSDTARYERSLRAQRLSYGRIIDRVLAQLHCGPSAQP